MLSFVSSRFRRGVLFSLFVAYLSQALPQATGAFFVDFSDSLGKAIEIPTSAVSSAALPVGLNGTTQDVSGLLRNTTGAAAAITNLVFAHHIVGNTYNYSVSNWATDISLAASKGVDAFALNVGVDSWEPGQVANAFAAAKKFGTSFKLFLSFDMTSLPCASASDGTLLRNYVTTYANHPNQFNVSNSVFVSTFAGQTCKFGTSSVNQGWTSVLKTNLPSTYFVPAFFIDPATFKTYTVLDGAFNWNSAWPLGNYDTNFTTDQTYLNGLGSRSYMAGVSPWFFTHYGPNSYNKNFIYRGDDWLFAERWEDLINNRARVPFAQVISWNDYGESHYVGPVQGVQPMSQAWVNGFDHQGWLDLMKYYITAFKTGVYPAVTKDRIFLWGRLYPAAASSPDSVPRPTNWQWTQDYVWAVFVLTSPAQVQLTCGTSSTRAALPAGLSKLSLGLTTTCSVSANITRAVTGSGGQMTMSTTTFAPTGYKFSLNPPSYNFNAFVAASPA